MQDVREIAVNHTPSLGSRDPITPIGAPPALSNRSNAGTNTATNSRESFQSGGHGKIRNLGAYLRDRLFGGHNEGGVYGDIAQRSDTGYLPPSLPVHELTAEEVRRMISPSLFENVTPSLDFPKSAQRRLLAGLEEAMGARDSRHNVFLTRYGDGAASVANLLKGLPVEQQEPKDYAYVRNFDNQNEPLLLKFQPGRGKAFSDTMEETLKKLVDDLVLINGEDDFIDKKADIIRTANAEISQRTQNRQKELEEEGFGIVHPPNMPPGMVVVGMKLLVLPEEVGIRVRPGRNGKSDLDAKTPILVVHALEVLEAKVAEMQSKGKDPVFVKLKILDPGGAMAVSGYKLMDRKEWEKEHRDPAVQAGNNDYPPAFTMEQVRQEYNEVERSSMKLNEANKATMFRSSRSINDLTKQVAGERIDTIFDPVKKEYPDPAVSRYLDGIKESILKNVDLFTKMEEEIAAEAGMHSSGDGPNPAQIMMAKSRFVRSYKPNLITCSSCDGRDGSFPVVTEENPTWENVMGTINEPAVILGANDLLPSDRHMNIKGGSLLRAQGGVFIVDLEKAYQYRSLGGILRAIETGEIQIEPGTAWSSNKPQAIPFNTKVIFLDPHGFYDILERVDDTYAKMFVKAPYNLSPRVKDENVKEVAANILAKAQRESIGKVTPGAIAAVFEEAMRKIGRQERFFADQDSAMEVLRGADIVARKEGASEITTDHVNQYLENRRFRYNLQEKRMQEMQGPHEEGKYYIIETHGEAVGQINGLVVYGSHSNANEPSKIPAKNLFGIAEEIFGKEWVAANGAELLKAKAEVENLQAKSLQAERAASDDGTFGGPSRITAEVHNSRKDFTIIPNDLLADYFGRSTKKSFANLESFIKGKFGHDGKILYGEARESFEQCYEGIDGDSASLAETIALLSAFSDVPIKQGIAITGSMDIHSGNVNIRSADAQAIGGVNYKIAGFFDACKKQGLDGTQGVVIPISNSKDLMLRADIQEAVDKKQFHIWYVKSIDEAVEMLTGVRAGKIDPETGKYEEGTIYGLVEKKFDEYAQKQPNKGPGNAEEPLSHWYISGTVA